MSKLLKVLLNLDDTPLFQLPFIGDVTSTALIIVLLAIFAVIYSTASGLYGVVYTDLIQFILAMIGSIALFIIVYVKCGGGSQIVNQLTQSAGFKEQLLNFFPDFEKMDLLLFTFVVYLTISWWGGAQGGGYMAQRLLSCRNENDSFKATLWFAFSHYVLRPWPWIAVGIISIIYFPDLSGPELCYPKMIATALPVGLKGIMVTSILAAYMSTVDSHLNLVSAYLVNDIYRPYINSNAKPEFYVKIARFTMVAMLFLVMIVTFNISGILSVYKYLGVIGSGMGLIGIARWYWWRVNPWSEISAIITSLIIGNLLVFLLPDSLDANGKVIEDLFAVRLVINLIITTSVWLTVTFFTQEEPVPQEIEFYKKVRVPGLGWQRVAEQIGKTPQKGELPLNFAGWIFSALFLYSTLLGIGKLLFAEYATGSLLLLSSVITLLVSIKIVKRLLI